MDLQKIEDALIKIVNRSEKHIRLSSHHKCDYLDTVMSNYELAKNALAELKKSTSESEIEELTNALEGWNRAQWSYQHIAHDLCEYWGLRGTVNFGAYHDKKCAECTQKKAPYKLFGVD